MVEILATIGAAAIGAFFLAVVVFACIGLYVVVGRK